jgi:Holliday junction resolvase RusA-like endonuclease
MRAIGRGVLIHEKDKELKAWRRLIAAALTAAGAQPVGTHTPVRLDVVFWLPRPPSVSVKKRPLPSAKSADLDKAIRAVGDALSGVVIEDDSQITSVVAQKRYATDSEPPGAWIRITLDDIPTAVSPAG